MSWGMRITSIARPGLAADGPNKTTLHPLGLWEYLRGPNASWIVVGNCPAEPGGGAGAGVGSAILRPLGCMAGSGRLKGAGGAGCGQRSRLGDSRQLQRGRRSSCLHTNAGVVMNAQATGMGSVHVPAASRTC